MVRRRSDGKRKQQTKYRKKDSAYRSPEFNDHKTVFSTLAVSSDSDSGDNQNETEDLSVYDLSDEAKSDKFTSHWMKNTRPFKKYAGFRRLANTIGVETIISAIKTQHQDKVVQGDWSEEKFEYCLDRALKTGQMISHASFARYAFAFEHGREKLSSYHSGSTSSLYAEEEKSSKISDVLSAWEKLEQLEAEEDDNE